MQESLTDIQLKNLDRFYETTKHSLFTEEQTANLKSLVTREKVLFQQYYFPLNLQTVAVGYIMEFFLEISSFIESNNTLHSIQCDNLLLCSYLKRNTLQLIKEIKLRTGTAPIDEDITKIFYQLQIKSLKRILNIAIKFGFKNDCFNKLFKQFNHFNTISKGTCNLILHQINKTKIIHILHNQQCCLFDASDR